MWQNADGAGFGLNCPRPACNIGEKRGSVKLQAAPNSDAAPTWTDALDCRAAVRNGATSPGISRLSRAGRRSAARNSTAACSRVSNGSGSLTRRAGRRRVLEPDPVLLEYDLLDSADGPGVHLLALGSSKDHSQLLR
jgi:hypothetical protein